MKVKISPHAFRDLKSFPKNEVAIIIEEIKLLYNQLWPRPPKIKKLKTTGFYELRSGNYRIIFYKKGHQEIEIARIVQRKELERILKTLL